MFTGLVQGMGRVESILRSDRGARIVLETALTEQIREGDSVAVNGVCLTATNVDGKLFAAEVMNETLAHTSLGGLASDAPVNLELPLRAGDPLGGHIVQGHVDGIGKVASVGGDGFATLLEIETSPELLRYIAHKGSIAVDGVSLTVAEIDDASFTVSLIPETVERTNLGRSRPGTSVNVEVDVLAKYVEKLMGAGT